MAQDLIYHYTTAGGALGIVRTRRLWATDVSFLNDPSELEYSLEALSGWLRSSGDAANAADEDSPMVRGLSRDAFPRFGPYVVSFAKSDKQLGMWQAYSGPGGFCLGFDRSQLLDLFEKGLREPRSRGVDREEEEGKTHNFPLQAALVDVHYGTASLEQLARRMRANFAPREDGYALWPHLAELVSVKHPAWSHEEEVRLIVRNDGCIHMDPRVRVSPIHGLVSYIDVAFRMSALRTVTIAPGANIPQSQRALMALFSDGNRGAWDVEVRESDLPLAW